MPVNIPVKLFSELFTRLVPYIGFTVWGQVVDIREEARVPTCPPRPSDLEDY
jgi:hypothetical protein